MFFGKGKKIIELEQELQELKEVERSFEEMTIIGLKQKISDLSDEAEALENKVASLSSREEKIKNKIAGEEDKVLSLKRELVSVQDDLTMESFGLYKPRYDFANSLEFKEKLTLIRQKQKDVIKDKQACTFNPNWRVNNSLAKGKKMTNDGIKQILRSFNNECEAAINKVKYSNLDSIEKRIIKSYEQLNKLNAINDIAIRHDYFMLKINELYLAYEYELKKQEEKEALREQREREREEKALEKEIVSKKKIIDKDIKHYKNMIEELEEKIKKLTTPDESLEKELAGLKNSIKEKEAEKEELDYRNAHAYAGYVYVISNIGAFGKDVVKIGVTRRLDPTERISELSSASVPFRFDTHALIFSYDAYKLESELHQFFEKYRINKVNSRKEFFKIPIEEIEAKLKEYNDLTIDFEMKADAEEYYQSLAINHEMV